jgi:hypothetical protein
MKRTLIIAAMLLAIGGVVSAGNNPAKRTSREISVLPFDKLSVSANVTVILYESPTANTVIVKGKDSHARNIVVLQKDSRLLITSNNGDDLKDRVTVFIPVYKLKSLDVSNDAVIRSQTILDCPNLDVETDGLCQIHIIVSGNVNIKEGGNYSLVRRIKPEDAVVKMILPVAY